MKRTIGVKSRELLRIRSVDSGALSICIYLSCDPKGRQQRVPFYRYYYRLDYFFYRNPTM